MRFDTFAFFSAIAAIYLRYPPVLNTRSPKSLLVQLLVGELLLLLLAGLQVSVPGMFSERKRLTSLDAR